MHARCDGKIDCVDDSDEFDCLLVEQSSAYKKQLSPPPEGNKTMSEVQMSIDIINLEKIDEIKASVVYQYLLFLTWYEGRLRFQNLKTTGTNQLESKEAEQLWVPRIVFYNTGERLENLMDEKTTTTVQRKGDFTTVKNRQLFKGSENPLTSSRFYRTTFVCNFDMAWYPFDTKKCSMDFVVENSNADYVDIVDGNLTYSGPLELTQYFVKKITLS